MRPSIHSSTGGHRSVLPRVLLALCAASGAVPVYALETDQYLAWGHELTDSSQRVNQLLNREIRSALSVINRRTPPIEDCQEVPRRVYLHLFPGLLAPRIRDLIKEDPQVQLFPSDTGYREYLEKSIYRKPAFPYILPMAYTIRVGNVRFGMDKFGHLFGFGRRYYVRYLSARRRGADEEDALRKVVLGGLRLERIFVGGLADGIFSYADLEANYQGLRLALDFCHGDRPYLGRIHSGWELQREVDLRDYINPRFDEAYYNNHHSRRRWKKVRPILEAEYCSRLSVPAVQAMLREYRAADRPSFSHQFIAEYFAKRGPSLQQQQALSTVCRSADSKLFERLADGTASDSK